MSHFRNIILGAGPAGLQMAHYFEERSEPYLIVERATRPGSFFSQYPRHETLLSINKVHTGYGDLESRRRYDWNSLLCEDECLQFKQYAREYFPSAKQLTDYLSDFARQRDLQIRYDTEVVRVHRDQRGYHLQLRDGEVLDCERLVVATGLSREQLPEVEGLDLCESYANFSIDPDDYVDKRVLIVGKGNSAFETADNLIETTRKIWIVGKRNIRLAWGTHFVGDLRAINNNFLDTYQLKAQNNILDGELRSVRRSEAGELIATIYFESRARSFDFPCDHVLLCTGFCFDASIFDQSCKPALIHGDKLPAMTCEWESTTAPNMFFAGTLMQARDYHMTMSAFIHGFRHNIEALDAMLKRRDAASERWPHTLPFGDTPEALAQLLLDRISTSAAMLLQPGYLIDAVGLRPDGGVDYLADVPADFVREKLALQYRRMAHISLEYKVHDGHLDPFNMPRGRGVDEDFYLHPIVRTIEDRQQVGRFILPDDLDNDWRNDPSYYPRVLEYVRDALWNHRAPDQQAVGCAAPPPAS